MLTKPTALNWSESNSASLHQTQGVSVGPFLRGRGRALEPFRGAAQVPALLHDQDRQTATSFRGEGCVSVSHENLRGQDLSVVTHILHGGSRFTSPVHNVPRQYS